MFFIYKFECENYNTHIINMSSTSGESHTHFQQMGFNKDWTPYVSDKARLNFASLYHQPVVMEGTTQPHI